MGMRYDVSHESRNRSTSLKENRATAKPAYVPIIIFLDGASLPFDSGHLVGHCVLEYVLYAVFVQTACCSVIQQTAHLQTLATALSYW